MRNVQDYWTETPNGYSSFISDLPPAETGLISTPDGVVVPLSMFTVRKDADGDISHWSYKSANGKMYTIFND